uniref:NHL repeat protein n=1 Tax=Gongylonema pulchrum TaxID=637853 RepID=A0A183EIB3_9BILA
LFFFRADVDCPLGWEQLIEGDEFAFEALCSISSNLLLAATCSIPVNMYSKQRLRLIDTRDGKVIKIFSKMGKNDGEIYFPRCIQRYNENIFVLDKTGRIQEFTLDGKFVRIAAQIDAYIGNAFVIEDDGVALLACSGIVLDRDNQTICDDWLEKVPLNGSKWLPDLNHGDRR